MRNWSPGVALVALLSVAGCKRDAPRSSASDPARVSVTGPTVIAYFVIPAGAVDTLPDLAVEADDWNVSMASLGDSLQASGIRFAMTTEPRIRVSVEGRADTTLSLGAFRASGYVFVGPRGIPLCVRPGGADPDSVKAVARAYFRASMRGAAC